MSTNGVVYPSIYMTVIETDIPHHVNRFSFVTLSGFTGVLSYLNGRHDVLINNNMWTQDLDSNFMNPNTRKFQFTIEVDTCIPGINIDTAGYITNPFGNPVATVQIGPITPGSEYRTLMDVQYDFFYNMFQFATHSFFINYLPTTGATVQQRQRVIPTFSQLQTRLRANTAINATAQTRMVASGSSMFVNPGISVVVSATPARQEVPLNNPYGISGLRPSIWDYNVPLENYLDKTPGFEARNIWWRLTGTATNQYQQRAGQFYYGDPTLGQTFESIVWPINGTVPPSTFPVPGAQYFQMGNSIRASYNAITAQQYIFGRINPNYTGGKNVGYVRFQNTSGQDPQRYMFLEDLAPRPPAFPIDTTINNPRVNIESQIRVLTAGMSYILNVLNCTSIVLDMRSNSGGFTSIQSFCNLIGDDRLGAESISSLKDTGFSVPLYGPTGFPNKPIYKDIINKNSDNLGFISPSRSNIYYPGSVFQGTVSNPKKVYCLTDSKSASGGDYSAHLFLGNNSPPTNRDLGANVKCKLLGDVNGIVSGASGYSINQTRKETDFIVTDTLGRPFAFNSYDLEGSNNIIRKCKNEPVSLNSRGSWLYPDSVIPIPAPGNPSLGPTPWDNSWEAVAYPYLGAAGFAPLLPRLPGDARPNPNVLPLYPAQPVAADRLLWRDVWLEQTVYDIIQ